MKWFGFLNKIDENIKPFFNIASRKKIPVIVCYRGDEKGVRNKILRNGGKIKHAYGLMKAVACELDSGGIDRMAETPEVTFICLDYKGSLCMKRVHDVLQIENARRFNLSGKGVGIGFVDTGFYPTGDIVNDRSLPVYFEDLVNGFKKPYDDNGHGTFIVGCASGKWDVSGIAPNSDICMIKAFDSLGKGYMSDIIKAIEIINEKKQVYNIKILCLPFEFPYVLKLKINPLEEIIKKTIQNNVSVFVPAGNYGSQATSIYFPGSIKDAITVGSCGHHIERYGEYRVSPFSGRGPDLTGAPKPDLIVPGENITSLNSDITYLPIRKMVPELQNKFKTMSGTSVACSIAAGYGALIYEKSPDLTPKDLKSIMLLSCISIGENKFSQGKGILSFEKILK